MGDNGVPQDQSSREAEGCQEVTVVRSAVACKNPQLGHLLHSCDCRVPEPPHLLPRGQIHITLPGQDRALQGLNEVSRHLNSAAKN